MAGSSDVMPMEPIADKWRAFGWDVVRASTGTIFPALLAALAPAVEARTVRAPRMVVADTVKGKGVSFMEDVRSWHADAITPEQYARVVAELRGGRHDRADPCDRSAAIAAHRAALSA